MKEHQYTSNSWQMVTDQIKAHLGIKILTEQLAIDIMGMYTQGMKTEDIIKKLEEREI